MIIPIGTDNPIRRTPIVNYAFIAINLVIFVFSLKYLNMPAGSPVREDFDKFVLHPGMPMLYQFITYAFLHGSWGHVLGNMLFLYIFGNNVNDKLGNVGYALFYLGGAVFSGIGHVYLGGTSVLGASGAVAAVTGAYMVLFPLTSVHVLYWLFFIGTMEVSAFYFILFKLFIWDNMIEPNLRTGTSNVAYTAHVAGYIYGVALPMFMLAIGVLPRSHFDLWALVQRWRRRQTYRHLVQEGFNPYDKAPAGRRKVESSVRDVQPEVTETQMKIRAEIFELINKGKASDAAGLYLHLIKADPKQVLPQQPLLDIANQLMHEGSHTEAAQAYETFLEHYDNYPFLEQVQLMLGLLYSRYLGQKEPARKNLEAALQKLTNDSQRQMCEDELKRLK